MKTKSGYVALLGILFSLSAFFAQPAFADDAGFEQQVRAVPIYGKNVLPAMEDALIKQGYAKGKDADAFTVDWDGTSYIASIYYSNPATGQAARFAIVGTSENGTVTIDSIAVSTEFL
jgi:hypothetical protein